MRDQIVPGLDDEDWECLDAGIAPRHEPTAADLRSALDNGRTGPGLTLLMSRRPDAGFVSDSEVLDSIRAYRNQESFAHGMLLMEVSELLSRRDSLPLNFLGADPGPHAEFVSGEIAGALRVSQSAAEALVDEAQQIVERLWATHDALLGGRIDVATARVIMTETACVSDEHLGAVEAAALGRAKTGTAAQVRHFTRRIAVKLDPANAREREKAAVANRRVTRGEPYDGVAELGVTLPVGDRDRVWAELDARARAIEPAEGDDRCLDENRADVLVQMITAPETVEPLTGPGVRFSDVVVAASTLSGADDEPGLLVGSGPVTAQTARELASGSTWRRLSVDENEQVIERSSRRHPPGGEPDDGPDASAARDRLDALLAEAITSQPLRRSTDRYRPTVSLVDHVEAVHRRCRFVGCRRAARRCDKDHVHAWRPDGRGGSTCVRNMIPLCRWHHRMKHSPGWSAHLDPDRSVTWTTPTGHRWTDPPPTVWD